MKLSRVMFAAPKSGSGKTTITCALLQTLKDRGESIASYKCGPDYIDSMFHQKVIGIPSGNLDTFFTSEEETKQLFLKNRAEGEFAVLEGVMGLYDGLGGIRQEGSSYHLAKVTKTPIILVVDAKGMGRSVIPVIAGFLAYDTEQLIKGILLNRMSKPYYETIKPLIEEELHIEVVGHVPEHKEFQIDSRHLGLIMPEEVEEIKEYLKKLSIELQKTISIEQIMDIAAAAEELKTDTLKTKEKKTVQDGGRPVIGVARDEAFCFYYEDNLLLLQEYGARLEFFSPIHDTELPDGCSGLLLGGGYPELHAKALSENKEMLKKIKDAVDSKMPVVAECGGFMYLHSVLRDKEGNSHAMVGAIPNQCHYTGKLVRFGYIELAELEHNFLPKGEKIKGHEFHYFDSEKNGRSCLASKPVTGKSYPCIVAGANYWAGFPHLYYPSNPVFAESFVKKANSYQKQSGHRIRDC